MTAGLKEMLLQEEKRLEKILTQVSERLKDVPDGALRLSFSKKWIQYYHCMPGEKKNGKYIPKTNKALAFKLAQKSYDEKIRKLAEKRLAQIRKITADYEDDEVEKIFIYEHPERKKLIRPVEQTWEQQVEIWLSNNYKCKEFRDGIPVIMTDRGERVRSKSEKILADYFYRRGILYKYECPVYLPGFGKVYPDFTFLSKRTRQEIYWEHHGMMDEPAYAENAVKKIYAYERNHIYVGERLILTFETGKTVLDTKLIEKLTDRYLV